MTHNEAIKNLQEIQVIMCRGNDEESIAYNNHILDTINYFVTQTVPLSVIEKIKAEIEALPEVYPFYNHIDSYVNTREVLKLIDQAIKECDR